MDLVFTYHAKQQMIARGVNEKQIMRCIKMGSKTIQTDGLLSSYGYIQVAYKIIGKKYIVKTVMIR